MTPEEARADLEARVRELMTYVIEHAMKKLDNLIGSGSGILQDHINAPGPFKTPRDFVVAYCDDLKWQHSPIAPNQTREWKKRVKNYYLLM